MEGKRKGSKCKKPQLKGYGINIKTRINVQWFVVGVNADTG